MPECLPTHACADIAAFATRLVTLNFTNIVIFNIPPFQVNLCVWYFIIKK